MIKQRRGVIKRIVNDMRLKNKLIVIFSCAVLLPLLILGMYNKYSMASSMLDSEKKTAEQETAQLANTLDMFLDTYLGVTNLLFTSIDLQNAIQEKPEDLVGQIGTKHEIANILSMVHSVIRFPEIRNSEYTQGQTILKLYITNDVLGGESGDVLKFDMVKNEPWCLELFEQRATVNWQAGIKINNIDYTALSRRLVSYQTGEDIGVLRLFIPVERMRRIIEKSITKTDNMVLYVSPDGVPIVSVNADGVNLEDVEATLENTEDPNGIGIYQKTYLLTSMQSQASGWQLYYFSSLQDMIGRERNVTIVMILMLLLSLMLCVVGSALLATLITRRLDELVAKTNRIGEGALVADLNLDGSDEIGLIDQNFNDMLLRINQLIDKEYKLNLHINQARLELLQEQINPHLLYNTLSMISMIAAETDNTVILEVCDDLIGFYKGSLSRGKLTASLRDEIGMVERYVRIMKFVYHMDIELVIDIDENIASYYTLKLLLQPLVENAILHGLRPAGGGVVMICGARDGDKIRLEISDSGVGIPDDIKSCVVSSMQGGDGRLGYGLINISKRNRLFFGEAFSMNISSFAGQGTKIILTIPLLTKEEMEALLSESFNI